MKPRRFNPMGDTRSRDRDRIRLTDQRKALCEARLDSHGLTDLGPWARSQGVAGWCLTDQSELLALVVKRHGREARDRLMDEVGL